MTRIASVLLALLLPAAVHAAEIVEFHDIAGTTFLRFEDTGVLTVSNGTNTFTYTASTGAIAASSLTATGTVSAEQLTSTDDATITDDLTVSGDLLTDSILEETSANGVVIDGVTVKDGGAVFADGATIEVDTVDEATAANGVAVDGVTLKDGAVTATGTVVGENIERVLCTATVNYNDTSPLTLCTVPASHTWFVRRVMINMTTGFDGTTPDLDIGVQGGDADGYIDGSAIAGFPDSAGMSWDHEMGVLLFDTTEDSTNLSTLAAAGVIEAVITPGGGGTAGVAVVYIIGYEIAS